MTKGAERLTFLVIFITVMGIGSSPHPMILALCYGIHELGHIFFAGVCGAKLHKMRLGVFRLCISYDTNRLTYPKELLVCAGGAVFNLVSALLASVFLLKRWGMCEYFVTFSVTLGLMNLYPVSILDGGGILKAVLNMLFSDPVAEKAMGAVSFFFAFLMWLVAVYLQIAFNTGLSLFVISCFLIVQLCFGVKK